MTTEEYVSKLVDPKVGLIKRVVTNTIPPDEPNVFFVGSEIGNVNRYTKRWFTNKVSSSVKLTKDEATIAAIGETVERYCACLYDESEMIFGNYEELYNTYPLINPKDVHLFSDRQYQTPGFPFHRFTKDLKIHWMKAKTIGDEKCYIPSQFVYMNFFNKPLFTYNTSNGLACGKSYEEAAYRAICELIERDAIMGVWYNGLSMPLIEYNNNIKEFVKKIFRNEIQTGFEIKIIDITNEFDVPTYLTILMKDKVFISTGASTNLNAFEAIKKAILEAIHGRLWSYTRSMKIFKDFASVRTFKDHMFYYMNEKGIEKLQFLWAGGMKKFQDKNRRKEYKELLDELKDILRINNIRLYLIDITTSDIVNGGLKVVRAYCPDLIPINMDCRYRFLGVPRIYDFPVKLGVSDILSKEEDLNPLPHPFP